MRPPSAPPLHRSCPRAGLPSTLLAALLLLALLAGCGPAGPGGPDGAGGDGAQRAGAAEEPRHGGTLVVGVTSDITTVNELLSSNSRLDNEVIYRTFLHLLDENPDFEDRPATFDPELATSYSWSEDHLTLTFELRRDAVWSDGAPVTAEDVRFTWQAQTDPDLAWHTAFWKEVIEDVEVVDPYTVRFHFSELSPDMLLRANEGVILPRHAWGELPFSEWRANARFFEENLVFSGPFALESWTPQQEVVLVRNERYFDPELPYLDRVVFRVIPETSNQVSQLLAGDLHVVEQVPIEDVDRLRSSDVARIHSYWHRLYVFTTWNARRTLFADAGVRRALTMAIDRQQIVDTLWGEFGRVATSPIVQNVWAHNDDIEPWPYDPERSREILADAGWVDRDGDGVLDRNGERFSFEILSNQGNQPRIDAAVMIQEHLARVGIEARPRVVEFNAMTERLLRGDFDAALFGWAMPTTLELRYAFHSSEAGEGRFNLSGYSNPRVDRLIERMEELPDLAASEPILMELQELIHRDQPVTFLWESQRINGYNRRVHPADPNLLSTFWYLRKWWLEPEE